MFLNIFKIGVLILALLQGISVFAVEKVGTDLIIFLEDRSKEKNNKTYFKKWMPLCTSLATFFENRDLSLGGGAFTKVSCSDKEQKIETMGKTTEASFALRVIDHSDQAAFEIYYLKGVNPRLEAQLQLNPSKKFAAMMKDKGALKFVALYLQDQLPFAHVVKMNYDQKNLRQNSRHKKMIQPDSLVVFDLGFDTKNERWRPRPIGRAKSPNKGVSYDLDLHDYILADGQQYLVQDERGRGQNLGTIEPLLREKLIPYKLMIRGFLSELAQGINASFVGIRYGISLLQPSDVVSRANLVSLFFENRSGFLRGIYFYYDTAPTVSQKEFGETVSFGWARSNFGYTFKLPILSFMGRAVDRWDVTPRIGMFTLKSTFATEFEGNVYTAHFNKKNDLDVGFESGLEKRFQNFMFRGWFGVNASSASMSRSGDGMISQKFGADGYYIATKNGKPMGFRLLAFALTELIDIHRKTSDPNAFIDGISYQLFLAGVGATYVW